VTADHATRAELETAWASRVQANRDQVDRLREVPDGPDFYAPVTGLFRADPRRTDEPVLEALRSLVAAGEGWLDIGAGAGRYALPIALVAGEVIAIDPSQGMLSTLGELMADFGIGNVRAIRGRWPPSTELAAELGSFPCADVALIAHVGYDIEEIDPFVDAMEAATRRLCVAVLMDRQPASVADPFWPPVHGEARVSLPALPEFVELLRARGRDPNVTMLEQKARLFGGRAELEAFLRRQLWIADGGEKERRFHVTLDELIVEEEGGSYLRTQAPMAIGLVSWRPSPADPG
jgi:SAM-dependent methyltransferase